MRIALAVAVLILLAGPVAAQHSGHHGAAPYAGQQQRSIKALSEQQIDDLRAGRGMGLALAAELNGYPGPMHVLELADRLDLTSTQRESVAILYESMRREAIEAGERLIAEEAVLNHLFSSGRITPEGLASTTTKIGEAQGQLRDVHLRYHLSTSALLSPGQIERYTELRGYR